MKIARRIVALTILALCASAGHAQSAFQVGVGTHIGDYALEPTRNALQSLGATIRDDVSWSDVETQPGILAAPAGKFQKLDDLLTSVISRNERPLLVLPRGNALYDQGGLITSTAGIAAYAAYARFVANRYKGRVDQFEVWNEWNRVSGGTAQSYARLLNAATQAIKAANPNAIVLGGGSGVSADDLKWVEELAAAGGLSQIDGLAVHPYVHCNAKARPRAPNLKSLSNTLHELKNSLSPLSLAGAATAVEGGTPEESIALLDKLKARIDVLAPSRRLPIYITEMGWPTSTMECGVPEDIAAAYLQRFFLLAKARPWIAGVWWYDLFDDGVDATKREHRFGLMRQDRLPKQAYTALSDIVDLLDAPTVPTVTTGAKGELTVRGQRADGRPFHVAWLPSTDFLTRQTWMQAQGLLGNGYRVTGRQQLGADFSIGATPTLLVKE
jgi:hypothetical protein